MLSCIKVDPYWKIGTVHANIKYKFHFIIGSLQMDTLVSDIVWSMRPGIVMMRFMRFSTQVCQKGVGLRKYSR